MSRTLGTLVRMAVASLAIVAMSAISHASATAAPDDGVSISGIEVKRGHLVGLVTSTSGTAAIDTALTVGVAGKSYPVDAITSGQGSPVSRTAVVVVDTSGSMGAAGMETVRSAVAAFLKSVPDDVRIGVVSFAAKPAMNLAPTTDHTKVQSAVNTLRAQGETALYDGLALAVQTLGSGAGEKSILLLSDGGDTASTRATRTSVTASLKKNRVRTEAVAFKTGDSDNAVLRDFAQAGGGHVVPAANAGAVQSAFTTAAKKLASQLSFSMPLPPGVKAVQKVSISGTAAGKKFTVTALVDLGEGVALPKPSSTVVSKTPIVGAKDLTVAPSERVDNVPWLGVPLPLALAAGAIFVGLLLVIFVTVSPTLKSGRRQRVENIDRYVAAGASVVSKAKGAKPKVISENLVFIGERVMEGRESTSRTMAHIERADLPLRAGEWWVLRILAMIAGVAAGMLLLRGGLWMTLFAAIVGLIAGIFLPSLVLRFLSGRRAKKFDAQLPDVLTLVASSLSTGFSLLQALDAVAKDAAEPAAKEFSRSLAETRIGSDVGDALERMASRMNSDNMRWTAMAIRIQREVGGNLAETLRTTAKTLREREELRRHVKALSAEGRLSAYILIALPIGIFFYTMNTNRAYIELLWTRPMGLVMIAFGLVSLGIGMFWMRKVVDVQV